jgi:hypothetical protein
MFFGQGVGEDNWGNAKHYLMALIVDRKRGIPI